MQNYAQEKHGCGPEIEASEEPAKLNTNKGNVLSEVQQCLVVAVQRMEDGSFKTRSIGARFFSLRASVDQPGSECGLADGRLRGL